MGSSPWYFLHVPKTGGTTFRVALENRFHMERICPAYELHAITRYPPQALRNFDLFRGHMGHLLTRLLPFPVRVAMLFRDPEARLVSHFRHIGRDPHHPRHALVAQEGLSLGDFLRDAELARELTNQQTRQLGQGLPREMLLELLQASDSQAEFARRYRACVPATEASDGQDLERALERLEQLDFIGLTERMDETLRLLAWRLGGAPPRGVPVLNSGDRPSLSEAEQAAVRQATWADRRLVARARVLFGQRLQTMLQALGERWYRDHWRLPPVAERLTVDFSEPLQGTGWHQRELLPGVGVMRWTGPGTRAELHLPLDCARGYRFEAEVVRWLEASDLDALRFEIDGQPVTVRREETPEGHCRFRGRFPPPRPRSDTPYVLFSVSVPALRTLPDGRRVGVALSGVRFQA